MRGRLDWLVQRIVVDCNVDCYSNTCHFATVIVTGVSLVSDPEVPIRSMVVVPVGALLVALQVIVTFELPFAGGVTGLPCTSARSVIGKA